MSIERRKIMDYKFKTKPYAHQLTALEKSWNKETFAYFMEMGTGKSKVLLDNIAMLYDKGKINGVLIIAPKGVIKTWHEQEIPTHLPDHVEIEAVLWQAAITKKQQEKLNTLFKPEVDLHIFIMNVTTAIINTNNVIITTIPPHNRHNHHTGNPHHCHHHHNHHTPLFVLFTVRRNICVELLSYQPLIYTFSVSTTVSLLTKKFF